MQSNSKNIDYARDTKNVWNEVYFYSREHEPIHVHVKSADGKAKFDILPEGIVLVKNEGIKTKDIKAAEMVLEENKELAIEKWNEYFGKSVKDEDF